MKTLVLWSGGHDSTYLIQRLLEEGGQVDAGYVDLLNNPAKSACEKSAIDKLIEILERESRFRYLGIIATVGVPRPSLSLQLTQAAIWVSIAATTADPTIHEQVALAYVLGDDAVSWLSDILAVYKANERLHNRPLPPLVWPLVKTSKAYVLQALRPELRVHCVTCEFPRPCKDGWRACGRCRCCRRLAEIKRIAKEINR